MHFRNIRGLVIAAAVLATTPALAQPTDVGAINANYKDPNGMEETYIRHFQRM